MCLENDFFRRIFYFIDLVYRDVPESKLRQLGMMFEFRRCDRHSIICREGEKGEGFFVLARGSVGVAAL